ncbi:hypothetical protein ANN_18030 [Periplaneta americana]|uniref:Uncharacterized protein n=1 Tax=Periplaneta americana TaxID=6978 RepID=A0ABQ8SMN0_PERAM|nr:hypothetical protein ANN_18030 [Periplaneta americana]
MTKKAPDDYREDSTTMRKTIDDDKEGSTTMTKKAPDDDKEDSTVMRKTNSQILVVTYSASESSHPESRHPGSTVNTSKKYTKTPEKSRHKLKRSTSFRAKRKGPELRFAMLGFALFSCRKQLPATRRSKRSQAYRTTTWVHVGQPVEGLKDLAETPHTTHIKGTGAGFKFSLVTCPYHLLPSEKWGEKYTSVRKIFGAKRDEVTGEWRKLHNTELHALYSSPDIIRNLKSRRLRWAGHVARMGESRNAYRVLVGRPEGKRPLGRPRRRWEDNIKMDLREVGYDDRDWMNLAEDRDRWRAYVRAAMNLRVP